MNNIFFTSDTHFFHNNIIKYCNRPFENVEEMNEIIIRNWNNIVTDNDIIYHLGDVAFCNNELLKSVIERLNGNKFLIRGNHDQKRVAIYEDLGFTVLKNAPIKLEEYKLILSHVPLPDTAIPKDYINVHGHIHNTPLHEVGKDRGTFFETYPKELYSDDKHICVCVDVTNFTPIHMDELLKKIK